jgi:hypothetical protein
MPGPSRHSESENTKSLYSDHPGELFALAPRMIKSAAQFLLTATLCLASVQDAALAATLQSSAEASIVGYDDPNPFASAEICQMKAEDFLAKAEHPSNLTSNFNDDGPLGTGLCWWHTKMQRAALYLAVFDGPDQPLPTREEALQIFAKLRDLKEVVSIPGFKNWFDFTQAFHDEFYQILGQWEIQDSMQLQFWKGVRALKTTDAATLKNISLEINEYKRLTFVLLKMPYFEAHSWLAQSFELEGTDFKIGFIDSNSPSHVNQYESKGNNYMFQTHNGFETTTDPKTGLTSGRYLWPAKKESKSFPNKKGLVVPIGRDGKSMTFYLQNDNLDFQKITAAVKTHCGGETPFTLHEKEVVKLKVQREFERQNWYRPGVPHN